MKKWLTILIFIIPLSMIINVHQSKLYLQTKTSINNLLRQQNQLLEENQRIIAEIARNRAPTVIERRIQSEGVGLGKISPNQVLRIMVPEANEAP